MSFGENLINLRKQKGWSQDDLADNLNLSRQAISKWENDTSKPDIDNIEKISKIFSVSIDDLLNNDVVKDKAVTLNVREKEKKERTLTIVKCMIIAVIILYIINVIFKFASLLIIVNGIQKYANLSNYHYVITTYDENGLLETEECWFKDGESKTINTVFKNQEIQETITYINYIDKKGYIKDFDNKLILNVDEYLLTHKNYDNGGQFYSKLPVQFNINSLKDLYIKGMGIISIKYFGKEILIETSNQFITANMNDLLTYTIFSRDEVKECFESKKYKIEIGAVDKI